MSVDQIERVATEEELLDIFRNCFRRHAGGVVVLTSVDELGAPIGFTATSLASLSAVPARATVNVIKKSNGYRAIRPGNRVIVNFLGADAEALGALYAGPFERRFEGDHWEWRDGVPALPGAAIRLSTEISDIYDQGENAIVVLSITDGDFGEDRDPLLYCNRKFGTMSELSHAVA